MGNITTIQVTHELIEALKIRKMFDKESYEDIIWDMLEDSMEVNEETKKRILKAQQQFKEGKYKTHEEVKRRFL